MSGGANEDPFKKEELASKGIPNNEIILFVLIGEQLIQMYKYIQYNHLLFIK
jgi:hypothetical protein